VKELLDEDRMAARAARLFSSLGGAGHAVDFTYRVERI
jgi:hypothetical protein